MELRFKDSYKGSEAIESNQVQDNVLPPHPGLRTTFSRHWGEGKKAAFTLAEVLITLGIIGIVAAMTLPTLIQKQQEKQRVAQLQKTYSVLSQAYTMSTMEYGEIKNWGFSSTTTGEVDSDGNPVYDESGRVLVANRFKQYLKKSGANKTHTFRSFTSLDGRNYDTTGSSTLQAKDSIIYLADGTIVSFGWLYKDCSNVDVSCGDIQVFLPERDARLGVSMFYFYLSPNGIMPYGGSKHSRPFKDYCDTKNTKGIVATAQGRGCTAWVIYNGNMDYLHCDDLSWDGKTKCK